MRFSVKLIVTIVIVVSLAFSLGGTLMLAFNFDAARQEAVAQNASRHRLACYTLASQLLSDRLRGIAFSSDALAQYADSLASYAPGFYLNVMLPSGATVFSNFEASIPELAADSYAISSGGDAYTCYFQSAIAVAGADLTITSGYDISPIYHERERQYHTFLAIEAGVLLCAALAALIISRAITKPLRALSHASKRIAGGEYSLRTAIAMGDEIGAFSHSFDSMVDALQQEMEKRTAFVAGFSHELKTPMTSMIGYADLLRSRSLSEDEKFLYADAIYKNSKRLEALSSKMMSLLRLSDEAIPLQPVPMEGIARRLLLLFPSEAAMLNCQMENATVRAEPELLLTLLRNLVENALRASRGTPVSIAGQVQEGNYVVRVTDQGIGMTPEQVRRATEPFYQADGSRSGDGSGIGLSICQRICECHGTSLRIASEPGRGTTVSFALEVIL